MAILSMLAWSSLYAIYSFTHLLAMFLVLLRLKVLLVAFQPILIHLELVLFLRPDSTGTTEAGPHADIHKPSIEPFFVNKRR